MKTLLTGFISSITGIIYIRSLFLCPLIFITASNLYAQSTLGGNKELRKMKYDSADWVFLREFVPAYNRVWHTTPQVGDGFTVNAPVMGNGDMVACISGNDSTQIYYMRTADFWTDNGLKKKEVREIPAGCLKISFNRLTKGGRQFMTPDSSIKYRQEEDMLNAEIKSTLLFSGSSLKLTSYVAATENTLVVELVNDGPEPVGVSVELNTDVFDRVAYPCTAGIKRDQLLLTRETCNRKGARWISRAAFATRILDAAKIEYYTNKSKDPRSGARFELPAHKAVTIVTCLNGGKNVVTRLALKAAERRVAAFTDRDITMLTKSHRDWWKTNWWLKSYVRTYDDTMDKYYYRCLYQLGTMCRAGNVNSGLEGPWKVSDTKGKYSYVLNDLGSASYYIPLITSNRASTAKMWVQTIYDWIPEGRRRAKSAGLKGVLFPVHIAPWGSTYEDVYWGQKFCASYASLIGDWYYKYVEDKKYLKTRIYPFMKECADFYEDWLTKEPDGKYHVKGASYESKTDDYMNSCMDLLCAKMLFTDIVKYSRVLGIDSDRRAKWEDIRDNLNHYSTTTFNGKVVYQADATTKFNRSIDIIQTQIIYPGYDCNRFSGSKTKEIGYNTIKEATKVGGWSQDNMRGQGLYVAALRIGKFNISNLIKHFDEMLASGPISYAKYVADLGLWEFNNELCLQSYDEGVIFFPNYPKDRIASFKRLRAYGGFLCSGQFRDGAATDLTVYSEKGNSFTFIDPWNSSSIVEVQEEDGTKVSTRRDGKKYTFNTSPGKEYSIIHVANR